MLFLLTISSTVSTALVSTLGATSEWTVLECNDPFICASQSLNLSASEAQCYGYGSCTNAVSKNSESVCSGSHSCVSSTIISDDVHCEGYSSCAYSNMTITTLLLAKGELSLHESTITFVGNGTETTKADIRGYRALSHANMYISSGDFDFYCSSYKCAEHTVIYVSSENVDGIYLRFHGTQAAYNTTVICNTGITCRVYCQADACNDINLIENGGTFGKSAASDTPLPSYALIEELQTSLSVPYEFDLTWYPSECSYNNSNAVICDSLSECQRAEFNHTHMNNSTCCLGRTSCQYVTWDLHPNDTAVETQSMFCDGYATCWDAEILSATAFFSRAYSGAHSMSQINIGGLAKHGYCTGGSSCTESVIESVNNLHCLGGESCRLSTVAVARNIFALAANALALSEVLHVYDSIYCVGDTVCGESDINNVGGTLYAIGSSAMRESNITNVSRLTCQGYRSLYNTNVRAVKDITVSQESCLHESNITSALDGDIFNISIYKKQYIYQESRLTCSSNDTCHIGCFDSGACGNLMLYCYGKCFVECFESDCPPVSYGNVTFIIFKSGSNSESFNAGWWPYAVGFGIGALCAIGVGVACFKYRKHAKIMSKHENNLNKSKQGESGVSEAEMESGVPETAGRDEQPDSSPNGVSALGTASPESFGESNGDDHFEMYEEGPSSAGKQSLAHGDEQNDDEVDVEDLFNCNQDDGTAAGATSGGDTESQSPGNKPTDIAQNSVQIVKDDEQTVEGSTL